MPEKIDHRVVRAMERYGVELTPMDVREIAKLATVQNIGRRMEDGTAVHVICWRGTTFAALIAQGDHGPVVCTFMPADYFTPMRRRNGESVVFKKAGKLRSHAKTKRFARRIGHRIAADPVSGEA
jgi:hypothetical protein